MTDFAALRTMMVDTQVRPSDVTKFTVIAAMLEVPRERFVPAAQRQTAYVGENIAIAPNRVLLEPRTIAKMLDALDIEPTELVLDIGAGFGYSTALIAQMAEAVIAVEENEELASEAETALTETGVDNAVFVSAPLSEGASKHGPYEVIIIEGAVETVPDEILDQLKEDGRIACVFMENHLGVCRIGYKSGGKITWRDAFNASAPLLPGFEHEKAFVL